MNRLTINHGSFNLDEIDLDHGTLTIGRASDNDIKLDDSAVSSHHAKIVTFFNVTYIEDLDSTNGTIVNGRAVKKYTLHSGDIVLLGKHQLLFHGDSAAENAGSDSTVVMSKTDVKNALAQTPPSTATAARAASAATARPVMATPPQSVQTSQSFANPQSVATPQGAQAKSNAFAEHGIAPEFGENFKSDDIIHSRVPGAKAEPQQASMHAEAAVVEPPPRPVAKAAPQNHATAIDSNATAEKASNTVSSEKPPETNPLGSLQQHNDAFSLLDSDDDGVADASNTGHADDYKLADTPMKAYSSDESLLIPAFIKSDKTAANIPTNNPTREKNAAANSPKAMHADRNDPVEAESMFTDTVPPTARPAPTKPAARKVLEDRSVGFGEPVDASAPIGIKEIDRVAQYNAKSSTNPNIPAVGDRTLLKQIITGDSDFSSSRNKFEIVQIILGVVIFAIIALIAFASF